MAILKAQDVGVRIEGGRIRLRIGGKTHYLEAVEARRLSENLGAVAMDAIRPEQTNRFPTVEDVYLRPVGNGAALLGLTASGENFAYRVQPRELRALATASTLALERGDLDGHA